MNSTMELLQWLESYEQPLRSADTLAALRFIAAVVTLTLSIILFYLKLKDRRRDRPPSLARTDTSWDIQSGFPIYPIPSPLTIAPFPFVPADLSTRTQSAGGWFTATELRIWNSGGGIVCGPSINPAAVACIDISKNIGPYEIGGCLTNDPDMKFHLGRPSHNHDAARERIPIYFDFMPEGKGILITIRHNSPDGELIDIKAFSDQAPNRVVGTYHVFQPRVTKFMNRLTYVAMMPAALFTAYLLYLGHTWLVFLPAIFTWSLIWSVYTQRKFTLAPDDLRWGNKRAKVL